MISDRRIKMVFILIDGYAKQIESATANKDVLAVVIRRSDFLSKPEVRETAVKEMENADAIITYSMGRPYFTISDEHVLVISRSRPFAAISATTEEIALSSVDGDVLSRIRDYLRAGGQQNMDRLIDYVKYAMLKTSGEDPLPADDAWYGLIHPDHNGIFGSLDDYISSYKSKIGALWVGLIIPRNSYMSDNVDPEMEMIRSFESKGFNVLAGFCSMSSGNEKEIGTPQFIRQFMFRDGKLMVDAIVKTSAQTISDSANQASDSGSELSSLLSKMDIPVFQPFIVSNQSRDSYRDSVGATRDAQFYITFPEVEGIIEPMIMGYGLDDDGERHRTPDKERIEHIVRRVARRISLRHKPNSEKKVAFILNNYPCAGSDSDVGDASDLDVPQSVIDIMKVMKARGYDVGDMPADGKALVRDILDHKAMSDFRWTPVSDIEKNGGVLAHIDNDDYLAWFSTLPDDVRAKMKESWGEPPGEGMVSEGRIIVTGRIYGNVIVAVQPKRGCYGPKCDGTVCRILHDPVCPPTHQYLATYRWLDKTWGADAVCHMGTHGNLELLPGKSVGLTASCYSDIALGDLPNLYVFNTDSLPAGMGAKRRSYATLIDHLQGTTVNACLNENLQRLDDILRQYSQSFDHAASDAYLNNLRKVAETAGLAHLLPEDITLEKAVRSCREELARVRNSRPKVGLHTFGRMPDGKDLAKLVYSAIRRNPAGTSIRDTVARCMGIDITALYADKGGYSDMMDMDNGSLLAHIEDVCLELVGRTIVSGDIIGSAKSMDLNVDSDSCELLIGEGKRIADVLMRINESDEIGSLMHALDGGYTLPGPAGRLSSGRYDVLPTGRNFFSMDLSIVPTEAAWEVGGKLAQATIDKHVEEKGSVPESVAFYWMCNDLVNSGGEMMSQMLHLLGVRPVRGSGGKVEGVEAVPLKELGRPRIDVSVRVSAVLKNGFESCLDLVDTAIRLVNSLDEPPEMNFIKAHSAESITSGTGEDDAMARMFSTRPGAASSGVNLAVYASAWKDERDLADLFIAGNGYAYGGGRDGKALHRQYADTLSKVNSVTVKTSSDEYTFIDSPAFGNLGGLVLASRVMSGKDVTAFCGDTRESDDICVRSLDNEFRRITQMEVLNPEWIKELKSHGYSGASSMMKRIGRIYGLEATSQLVDDKLFDEITKTYVLDDEMVAFFRDNNPYAFEEISRRLLEAEHRGLWKADPEVLSKLKDRYLEAESWMEGIVGDGDYQGGELEIKTYKDVEEWNSRSGDLLDRVHEMTGKKSERK